MTHAARSSLFACDSCEAGAAEVQKLVAKVAPLPSGLPPAISKGKKRKKTDEEKHADMLYYEYTLYNGFLRGHGGVPQVCENKPRRSHRRSTNLLPGAKRIHDTTTFLHLQQMQYSQSLRRLRHVLLVFRNLITRAALSSRVSRSLL